MKKDHNDSYLQGWADASERYKLLKDKVTELDAKLQVAVEVVESYHCQCAYVKEWGPNEVCSRCTTLEKIKAK